MFLRAALAIAICAVTAAVAPGPRARAATLQVPADYATIQEALDAATDGDVVLVAPGTWAGPVALAGKTVTLASHFALSGDPAFIAQTVIDGGGGSRAIFVDDTVGPATTIQGFTIRNGDDGIRADGSFRVLDSRITGTGDGIQYKGGGGLVQRCQIDHNQDDGIDLDDDVAVVIEDNEIVDNGGSPSLDGDGIEIRLQNYQGPTIQVVIRNNRIDRNTSDGIQLISYDITTQRVIRIEGNSFVANRLAALGMMCCTDSEEDFQGAALGERVLVAGNTFVGNGHGITGGDDVVVLNNLFVSTTQLALKRLRVRSIAAHNLFWQNGSNWSDAIVDVGSSLFQDPRLAPDLSLLPGSPAIDAGTAFFQHLGEVVLDLPPSAYVGSAPDLGAFEDAGAPPNAAPFVDAGPDQVLPSGFPALLDGTVLDDGQPSGSLELGWSVVEGPGSVSFDDASAEDPVASFSADGSYLLRLSADDSDLISVDDVVIHVIAGAGIVEQQVAVGADDAEETLATGAVLLGGAVLDLALQPGTLQPQQVGLRWQGLPIPQGSDIHQAWVQFEAALSALGSAELEVRGEPAGAAAPFSAAPGNLSARAPTAASLTWSPGLWVAGAAGLAQRTPDLSAIVQEIVDGEVWDEGDPLALHFAGSGIRSAASFEADPLAAPLLHVVFAPPVENQPPQVDAGPDAIILLGQSAPLGGEVVDDGLPEGQPLDFLWTVESGPPGASIDPPTDLATQAHFSQAGVYVLRLTADDGELASSDELVVSVIQNQPPSVAAGPDQSLLLPAAAERAANLAGSISDDGLPTGQLYVFWSVRSGPGTVSFQPAHTAISRALFSAPGTYVLRLTAFDGALGSFDELTVDVEQNQPPSVDAGPDRSIPITGSASLAGSASDDGLMAGQLELSWTLQSGPGSASFTNPTEAESEASFSAPGVYVLRLAADDGELGAFDELRVAVAIEDPGHLDGQVGAPDDDAEEDLRNGDINRDSTVLDIGRYTGSPARDQIVGLRFRDLAIPGGASVLSATLQLESAGANTGLAALIVRAQDADDAEPFSDATDNLSTRPTTSASVSWSPPDWTAAGVAGPGQAVDVTGPLQEVLERPGWSAGNALALLLSGTGTRRARSHNGNPAGAARLHVEYHAATCADGLDNDADGAVDFPEDAGCASAASSRENPACSDALDNDGDGAIDSPGNDFCTGPWQDVELDDGDGDGVVDPSDNCSELANPAQIDSNGDGFGNTCDPDYNDDGIVGVPDYALFAGKLGLACGAPGWDADLDLNGDCVLGVPDLATLVGFLGAPPGPSGLVASPAGLAAAPAAEGGTLEPASASVSPPPDAPEPEPQPGRAGAPRRARRAR